MSRWSILFILFAFMLGGCEADSSCSNPNPEHDPENPASVACLDDGVDAVAAAEDVTADEADSESDSPEETQSNGEEEEESGGTVYVAEDCSNDVDDDADGFVDCNDPECTEGPFCKESYCGNGVDDDGDGYTDCDDLNCEWSKACNVESCHDYYICLTESGCDCTVGIDCEFVYPGNYADYCANECWYDTGCKSKCYSKVSSAVQDDVTALNNCYNAHCVQETYLESACMDEHCADEQAYCFATGEDSCSEFLYCLRNCPYENSACVDECVENVSAEGTLEAAKWNVCVDSLYDLGNSGLGLPDSMWVPFIARHFACIEGAGECADGLVGMNPKVATGTCSDVTNCVIACSGWDEDLEACAYGCLDLLDEKDKGVVSDLFTCGVEECALEWSLNPSVCFQEVFSPEGACAKEATACDFQLAEPVEVPREEEREESVENEEEQEEPVEDEEGETSEGCAADEFDCGDGNCIPAEYQCDGWEDCESEIDEEGCFGEQGCAEDQFDCGGGFCIPAGWECDGYNDCETAIDEEGCSP